jgi:hypothetical protein
MGLEEAAPFLLGQDPGEGRRLPKPPGVFARIDQQREDLFEGTRVEQIEPLLRRVRHRKGKAAALESLANRSRTPVKSPGFCLTRRAISRCKARLRSSSLA